MHPKFLEGEVAERQRILALLREQREKRIARARSIEEADRIYHNYYYRGALDALRLLESEIEARK